VRIRDALTIPALFLVVQFWSYSQAGKKRLLAKHEDGVLRLVP
jgi:hypothetical protein